jgi:glutamyl-tRNA reductase
MLFFAGLSHKRASLSLRERCAVPAGERERVTERLRRQLPCTVLLSTCSRVELYIDHPDPKSAESVARAWFKERSDLSDSELNGCLDVTHGVDVVRRLTRVACGLESAIEGEDEILGQVRRAWLDAVDAGATSPDLNEAFRLAVRSGRQARRTGDPHAWTSLADTAAAHVALAVEHLPSPRILIAGSGPMGLRAARGLRARFGPAMDLTLAGRTPARVQRHAATLDACALGLEQIPQALTWADAAVVGLRTSHVLIGAGDVAPRPEGRPLEIVDLSVPRAVDVAVGAVSGVALLNVEHLTSGERAFTRWDRDDRTYIEVLVEQAVDEYTDRAEQSDSTATMTTLRLQAEGIRRRQVSDTLRRMPHLDGESRWMIDKLTRSILNRVLHDPTMRLKADADGTAALAARDLFALDTETPRTRCNGVDGR